MLKSKLQACYLKRCFVLVFSSSFFPITACKLSWDRAIEGQTIERDNKEYWWTLWPIKTFSVIKKWFGWGESNNDKEVWQFLEVHSINARRLLTISQSRQHPVMLVISIGLPFFQVWTFSCSTNVLLGMRGVVTLVLINAYFSLDVTGIWLPLPHLQETTLDWRGGLGSGCEAEKIKRQREWSWFMITLRLKTRTIRWKSEMLFIVSELIVRCCLYYSSQLQH